MQPTELPSLPKYQEQNAILKEIYIAELLIQLKVKENANELVQ